MNAIELARRAYTAESFHLKTERGVEAQAIGNITARLRRAASQKDENFASLASAIHENRKLWNTLAINVIDEENALPPVLRAQIFYLSEFTELISGKILKDEASVDVLIEINTSVMRGLNTTGAK